MASSVLIYTGRDTWPGWWIRLFTRSHYDHVAGERDGQIIEAVSPRVRLRADPRDVSQAIADAAHVVEAQPSSVDAEQIAWLWLRGEVGEWYGFTAIVTDLLEAFGLHPTWLFRLLRLFRVGGRYVCSSQQCRWLQLMGDPRVPADANPDDVEPGDIAQWLLGQRAPAA